ncbi:MAG TPA: hypothetical protein VLA34_11630, partial [Candidatus Krumholzibacterium sp.]|nr:hypothetical protein [Candidatus Krumholzibacterium sp.]
WSLFGRKGGVRVGVFGLTLPLFIHEIDPAIPKYYEVVDPRIAAMDAVSRLREEGCDVIIAISHQEWNNTLAFAGDVPGIDIVINGRRNHEMTYSEMADSALVVDTGTNRISFTEIEVAYRLGKRFIKATDLGARAHAAPERPDLVKLQEDYKKALTEAGISTEGI